MGSQTSETAKVSNLKFQGTLVGSQTSETTTVSHLKVIGLGPKNRDDDDDDDV